MLSLILATAVAGLDPIERPREPGYSPGPPPHFTVARLDKDVLIFTDAFYVPVTKKVQRTIKEGDIVKTIEETVTAFMVEMRERKVAVKDVQAFGGDGKKLDAKILAERLTKNTPVVVSTLDRPIDAFYLKALKDNAVVLILPQPKPVVLPEPVKPLPEPIKPLADAARPDR